MEEEVRLDKDRVKRHYNDLYWERRYTLCPERTPTFLGKLSDKILRTGKYLNVMRESGFPPQVPAATDLIYQLRERAYVDTIENGRFFLKTTIPMLHVLGCSDTLRRPRGGAGGVCGADRGAPASSRRGTCLLLSIFTLTWAFSIFDDCITLTPPSGFSYASRSLLDMLTTDLKLMDRLTSLKNYFCMGCGDFFSHFLDSAESELSKLVRDIVPSRLEALLEMVRSL